MFQHSLRGIYGTIRQLGICKSSRAPRNFGGLAVGVKNSIFDGITFLKYSHSEFLWIKLCKNFFGVKDDIYICSLYISPAGSKFL